MNAVLKPFVSEEICWVVSHHGVFQEYYYGHLTGGDRNARERYRGHPWFDACAEFCERYDQNCFDPDYESVPSSSSSRWCARCSGRRATSSD